MAVFLFFLTCLADHFLGVEKILKIYYNHIKTIFQRRCIMKCVKEECENDAQEGSKHCRECWAKFANECKERAIKCEGGTFPVRARM